MSSVPAPSAPDTLDPREQARLAIERAQGTVFRLRLPGASANA